MTTEKRGDHSRAARDPVDATRVLRPRPASDDSAAKQRSSDPSGNLNESEDPGSNKSESDPE